MQITRHNVLIPILYSRYTNSTLAVVHYRRIVNGYI